MAVSGFSLHPQLYVPSFYFCFSDLDSLNWATCSEFSIDPVLSRMLVLRPPRVTSSLNNSLSQWWWLYFSLGMWWTQTVPFIWEIRILYTIGSYLHRKKKKEKKKRKKGCTLKIQETCVYSNFVLVCIYKALSNVSSLSGFQWVLWLYSYILRKSKRHMD